MNYYGTRLTNNISRREPEGYLLCLNVPVARTGIQQYLPEELGLGSSERGSMIDVYRPEEEVFSPETMASFEGMPVTNDHPPEGVDISNIGDLHCGHAQNVRRGEGDESDLLLADLMIQDPYLIQMIMEEGKREISCGYTYELCEENGRYVQRKIRGNHVAVVDAGRAGHRVSIKDHALNRERSKGIMKKSLMKKLIRMAKDGDPDALEAVGELIEEIMDPETATPAEVVAEVVEEVAPAVAEAAAAAEAVEDPTAVVETPEATIVVDEDTLAEVLSRLDQIISLLTPAPVTADEDVEEETAEAIEEIVEAVMAEETEPEAVPGDVIEEIASVVEEVLDPTAETEDPAEDDCGDPDQGVITTGDALRTALQAMRPVLAKMPRKQRKRACADIAAKLACQRKAAGKTGKDSKLSAAMLNAKRRDSADHSDLGKRIMERRNPNYRK